MPITIVGLGPAGTRLLPDASRRLIESGSSEVIVRTVEHPAVRELAESVAMVACDDLYERHDDFDVVYGAIADRVMAAAMEGPVVYAVPGSPAVGESTVAIIRDRASEADISVEILGAPSFLDLAFVAVGVDPVADGVQILDAHRLPDPLPLHVPTFVAQVDSPLRAADLAVELGRLLDPEDEVIVLDRLGEPDAAVSPVTVESLARLEAGPRTTVYIAPRAVGLLGLVEVNRILRTACPWDMRQTHHSLLTHLVEEAYETADALGRLPFEAPGGEPDYGAYAEVEDELGDLLLQVIFHATMAAEAGAFDIDDVAEQNRRKLVHRHPHVFGDVEVEGADEVLANWEQIKKAEKQRTSLMDDIPTGMPGVARAMKVQKRASSVGFDWDDAAPVFDVVRAEIDELAAVEEERSATSDEIGDVLFAVINLSRHLRVDPEVALRGSVDRFMARFRHVESSFADRGMGIGEASPEQLDEAWAAAKRATTTP